MRARSFTRPALVAASLTLALGLAACGDDDPESKASDDGSTSQESGSPTNPDQTASATGTGECTYVPDGSPSVVDLPPATPTTNGPVDVTMKTTIGDFKLTLDSQRTPCTTNSFVSLVDQGFFDGTTCHRLTISDFFKVLQCGDPNGDGSGGPGYTIPAEFDGTETYPAGTLAMARAQSPDSGGSQFFIVYGDTGLDPAYTVFGTVDQATVDAITEAAKAGVTPVLGPEDGTPKTDISIDSASVD